jgi:hypothetical protein
MKSVAEILEVIKRIPGALIEQDAEEARRGSQPGIKTLWPGPEDKKHVDASGLSPEEDLSETANPIQIEEIFEIGAKIDEDRLIDAMNGSEGERIKQSVLVKGIDALGWYAPFHVKGQQWGIYVPLSGIAYMIQNVFGGLPQDIETKVLISFRAIHQHELFHFAVDYMAGQWEAVTGEPCYVSGKEKLRDKTLGYNVLEEECANGHMMRSFLGGRAILKVAGRKSALRKFISMQPEGYRDGDHKSISAFNSQCEKLVRNYLGTISAFEAPYLSAFDLMRSYPPLFPNLDWQYVPIHILNDGERMGLPADLLALFSRIEQPIVETEQFARSLAALPRNIRENWDRTRSRVKLTLHSSGMDFKRWKRTSDGEIYSLRLSNSHRVHLKRYRDSGQWSALNVGTHPQMGHG